MTKLLEENVTNPAIDFHEKIINKLVLRAYDFFGEEKYRQFRHIDSIHSFTTAFGVPQPRLGCFCDKEVYAQFRIDEYENNQCRKSRYLLKIIATWQDWKKYVHLSTIKINDYEVLNGPLFLENVCKGWPAIYFSVPVECLLHDNQLSIINKSEGNNTLIIERAEILKLTDIKDFTVLSCPEFVNVNSEFIIKLNMLKSYPELSVGYPEDIFELLSRENDEYRFFVKRKANEKIDITFTSGNSKCTAVVNEIYSEKNGRKVSVGMDCDDYRQDQTDELDRILKHFADTQMGGFIGFRPNPERNYPTKYPAKLSDWKRWIAFCKRNNISFQFSGIPEIQGKKISQIKQELVKAGGANLEGFQIHEPYLLFQPLGPQNPLLKKANNLELRKNAYLEFVDSQVDKLGFKGLKTFCGDPSLLSVYLRDSKIDSILCEPVSNSALLFGAARGTGKSFGAHIASDWYMGFPHDEMELRRLELMLNLIYAYGGEHIYLESTAFKTNSFKRHDWEDPFCCSVRQLLRDFYKMTCNDHRLGMPQTQLAFVYGNLESMFWRPDDCMPELADSGHWDDVVWGKWPNSQYRWLWRASDAWLPPLDFDTFGENESLTKMFSGTPYGPVDVISPFSQLEQYNAIAFLGWNTMNKAIFENLCNYVNNGGTLFICGCHFDTRVDLESESQMFNNGKISELTGVDIISRGQTVLENLATCNFENKGAIEKDEFLFEYTLGKGKTYFYNFYDYPCDLRIVNKIQSILEKIGENISQKSQICLEGDNKHLFNFNIWQDAKSLKLYLSNIDWQCEEFHDVMVRFNDKRKKVSVAGGGTVCIELLKFDF